VQGCQIEALCQTDEENKMMVMVTVVVVVVVVMMMMMMVVMMMMTTTTTANNVTEASAPLTPKPVIGRILQLVLRISYPNNLSP